MRPPAQQAASRANGALSRGPKTQDGKPRSSMDALSLHLLTKATVLKNNNLAMNRSVEQVAMRFVDGNNLNEGMLNRVQAVVRACTPA